MPTRDDVTPTYVTSPRVLEVDAPATEMTMQDLVDTARKLEDSFQGMGYFKLLDASGKEDLGGGVQVGITVAMQDTKLAFEGRTTPAQVGTVSTNPGTPVIGQDVFTDATATFITNNVQRGSLVINFTDQSIAEVVAVESETQLRTKTLVNGLGNSYDIGDAYQVFNIIQCNATGGNLTAVDSNGLSTTQILPTAFTQVVLTASASATTQNQDSLNFSTYQNRVTIKAGSGNNGTGFPIGTAEFPVDNLNDAKTIADNNGITNLKFIGNWTFSPGDNVDQYTLIGEGPTLTVLDLGASTSTVRTQIYNAELRGDVNGAINVVGCHIESITGVGSTTYETTFTDCLFEPGTAMTLAPGTGYQIINLVNCVSGSPGDVPVNYDWNGSDASSVIRRYDGGFRLLNCTQPAVELSFGGDGHLTIEASNTEGQAAVRGDIKITDRSGPNFTVKDQGTYNRLNELWQRLGLDPSEPLTTNDDNSITVGDITITAVNGATSTTQTRQP